MSSYDDSGAPDEQTHHGGHANPGLVVRIGDTVRRPRGPGHVLEEAVLTHLEQVGFAYAPRLLGIDASDRQVLTYVEGDVNPAPGWQADDAANAAELGRIAAVLRDLHRAMDGFVPPAGAAPKRPIPGATDADTEWNHADAGYQNIVYRDGQIAALIDWEYVACGDPLYDAASLVAMLARGPRPDRDDDERRADAVRAALDAVADGYGVSDAERARLPAVISAVLEDVAVYWHDVVDPENVGILRWKAAWFRHNGSLLT